MEIYFNEICEVYYVQTNGKDGYPTITELATLYFDVEDELEAVAYLLGSKQGGADCLLDGEALSKKPDDQYPKPNLKLTNISDKRLLEPIVSKLPKREHFSLQSSPVKQEDRSGKKKKEQR